MASTLPLASSPDAHLTAARVLGVVTSLASLALAMVSASAVADLAGGDVRGGVGILVAALAARWVLGEALEEWDEGVAQGLRVVWRRSLVAHLARPAREGARGRGNLAVAIEHVSRAPSLERLRAAAAASMVGLLVTFWAGGWLPLVITVALLALAAPLYQRAGRHAESMNQEHRQRRALLETRQLEVLQHAPELRALGAVDFGAAEVAALSESEHVLALRTIRAALESSLVTEFLSGVSIGLVAMVVGFALLDGRISLVRALVAVLVTSELFIQVRRYGIEFHRRDEASRAGVTLDVTPSSAADPREALVVAHALVTEAGDQVVDLSVAAGERVVVCGPSGVGKTTLLHTLLGWRRERSGSRAITSGPVGYVSAESALVSGSLRENLTLGDRVDDAAVFERLRSLGLTGPRFDDLDAELLADGRGLSTGERVRLTLARDLLAGASLLVLDDVAGVLDEASREMVRRALADLPELGLLEATVDNPLLTHATRRLELRA